MPKIPYIVCSKENCFEQSSHLESQVPNKKLTDNKLNNLLIIAKHTLVTKKYCSTEKRVGFTTEWTW